jgi:hypothetical protein
MSLRLHHDADPSDPESMTPEERREELAGIFARGILCLHTRSLPRDSAEQTRLDSAEASLDLPAPARPCVDAG